MHISSLPCLILVKVSNYSSNQKVLVPRHSRAEKNAPIQLGTGWVYITCIYNACIVYIHFGTGKRGLQPLFVVFWFQLRDLGRASLGLGWNLAKWSYTYNSLHSI